MLRLLARVGPSSTNVAWEIHYRRPTIVCILLVSRHISVRSAGRRAGRHPSHGVALACGQGAQTAWLLSACCVTRFLR